MANRSRDQLLRGEYHKASTFMLPFVTTLHSSTTILSKLVKSSFSEAFKDDPSLQYILPQPSIVVAYSKLPNLQLLLCKNDQKSLAVDAPLQNINGYTNTGCRCNVCKASTFGKYIRSPSMPGFQIKLTSNTTCKSGPGVIYHIVCNSNSPQCKLAHYVGRAWSSNNKKSAMGQRWSNHKCHFNKRKDKCRMTKHLLTFHKGEDPQTFCKITILQEVKTMEEAKAAELWWTRKLFAFHPSGLNVREEDELY